MNCLDLVKFKDYCSPTEQGPFVSDYVDVSTRFFAHLADDSEQTGRAYALELINAAKEQVWTDIQMSMADGYSVRDIVYHWVNTCRFTETYANFGITLTNFYRSQSSKIVIPQIKYKPELAGEFILVVDDGVEQKEYTINGQAKMEGIAVLNYETKSKQVKIYAKDSNLKFSMLTCQSGGCGSCAAKRGVHMQLQGWNRSAVSSQPSGFIPTAYVACDLDEVLCVVIARHKALFAKAMAYQVGIMAYTRLLISPRLNDTTLNIDQEAVKLYLNTLIGKYKELVFGSAQAYGNNAVAGIIKVMQETYKVLGDQCVICNSQINTATAVF
jgi:hypothetical protein